MVLFSCFLTDDCSPSIYTLKNMLTLFLFCFQATLLKCNHGCDRVGLVCSYQVSFHEQKTLILNSTPSSRPSLIVATILPNVERLELRVAFGCKC